MPREPRGTLQGALCHVIGRGNGGQPIFRDTADYARFTERMRRDVRRTSCALYAYVLMPNHCHLLVEVGQQPLAALMQPLLTAHAGYFNDKWGQTGHLFHRPYHAIVCERDAHLLELIRYLHLNPVRAGLCGDPQEWDWSSHRFYLGSRGGEWTRAREALALFGDDPQRALRAYRRFIADGIAMGHRPDFYPSHRTVRPASEGEARRALVGLCQTLGGRWEDVLSRARDEPAVRLRALAAYFATRHLGLGVEAAGQLLCRHPSAVSKAVRRAEALIAEDPALLNSLRLAAPLSQNGVPPGFA